MVRSAFVVVNTDTQRTYAQVECLSALIVIEKVIPKIHAGDEQQLATAAVNVDISNPIADIRMKSA